MSICTKCSGDGLIGNGPSPHLKQGHITTCPDCKGTGKIEDSSIPEKQGECVDSVIIPQPKRGILSIFRRNK